MMPRDEGALYAGNARFAAPGRRVSFDALMRGARDGAKHAANERRVCERRRAARTRSSMIAAHVAVRHDRGLRDDVTYACALLYDKASG